MENLREILSLQKQVGILLGAGVSKACGLPDISHLTNEVKQLISNESFISLIEDNDTIETMLNKLGQLRQLISPTRTINGLTQQMVVDIEKRIKETIYNELSIVTNHTKICSLVAWLNYVNNEYEKEIFTLNYDLMVENALEELQLPYFTGFVGTVKPFFLAESVDDYSGTYVKKNWTKLWKMHGSLNYKKTSDDKIFIESNVSKEYENLLIYPSMDKYLSSRKAPFISYLDRFRKYMLNGEKILFIIGYSFNDEHINEIINSSLTNNTRLSVITFAYDTETYTRCKTIFGVYPNFSIYTSGKKYLSRNEISLTNCPNIGDFNNLIDLLDKSLEPEKIEVTKNENN